MSCRFFDAHTHVQFAAFGKDYKEVIRRALSEGVGMVNVGTQKDTSRRAVEIAHEFENEPIYATVGLHPIHTDRDESFDYEYYKKLALDLKVVAIGECGLDFYRVTSSKKQETWKEKQKEAFVKQIELAKDVGKPLMIHCRDAYDDLIRLLVASYQLLVTPPGIVHFFSGTKEDAKKLLEMGFSFTFGGVITFIRDYDEIIKMIPLDRILSETDAPYVTPVPYRDKRNEPLYVIEIVKKLAELKNVSVERISEQILENAKRTFLI